MGWVYYCGYKRKIRAIKIRMLKKKIEINCIKLKDKDMGRQKQSLCDAD